MGSISGFASSPPEPLETAADETVVLAPQHKLGSSSEEIQMADIESTVSQEALIKPMEKTPEADPLIETAEFAHKPPLEIDLGAGPSSSEPAVESAQAVSEDEKTVVLSAADFAKTAGPAVVPQEALEPEPAAELPPEEFSSDETMVLSPGGSGFTPEQIAESLSEPAAPPVSKEEEPPEAASYDEKTIKIADINSILPRVAPGSATAADLSTSNLDEEIKIVQEKLAQENPSPKASPELPPEQTGDLGIQLTDPDKPS